jgi:hypothetical protein
MSDIKDSKELCKCSRCGSTVLLETYFSKNRKGEWNKTCDRCRASRKVQNSTPEMKAREQSNYIKNKEKVLVKCKEYRDNNKETIAARGKAYRIDHTTETSIRGKKWRSENREKLNKRYNERRATEPEFKLKSNLRGRIYKAMKGLNKSAPTMGLVGCTVEELKEHLASQFTENMTFENYGEWHVDHMQPCASFDLLDPEEQRKCFHYTNLQPLWAIDNIRKGAKLI